MTAPPPLAYRSPLPGERYVYGGLSCVISAVITNPVDVAKIRMQVHNEMAAAAAPPMGNAGAASAAVLRAAAPGFAATLRGLVRDEGAAGLFRGVTHSILREATYR